MRIVLLAAALPLLAACQSVPSNAPRATASLQPTKGNQTSGTVTFVEAGGKVRVNAVIVGLKRNGEHGFHVHEAGDCGSGDGMSTKGHFNPLGKPHAHFSTPDRHVGDMPALKANASGRAEANFELDVMTVSPGAASIVGRGLIVHADPDDYKTQPTGNAGARIACAVIQRS